MSRISIVILLCFIFSLNAYSQDVSLVLQKVPLLSAGEMASQWQSMSEPVQVSFGNSNTRYPGDRVPAVKQQRELQLEAWKGEKVHAQLLVWAKTTVPHVKLTLSDLTGANGQTIAKNNISAGFLEYVITDEYRDGCGLRQPQDFDSSLVADRINTTLQQVAVKQQTVQPIWVSIRVPASVMPGIYKGTIDVNADKRYRLQIAVNVLDKVLPAPSKWSFNLDLWQHPAAVARVHNVPLWSEQHFRLMRSYYTMLANAGQKNITTSIVNEPWGHQTYDDYPGLVKWTKKKNGTWQYDYSLFDKYVSFVMECGINRRINCYSMVPWKIAFQYYDEALNRDTVFTGAIGTPEYNVFWKTMLVDFTKHLKLKGWFDKTAIAMDERPMEHMQAVIKLLKEVDKNWKIALAGDYHSEIEPDVYDYCIASRLKFPGDTLQQRQQQGKLSTWYTCCTEKYPNGFTFSPPAEGVWIGVYSAAQHLDGYLRWAFNSWTKNPLADTRFRAWPAGDTYQVYPGALSSIRFEKLIEGIQDYEKIAILRREYKTQNNHNKLNELEAALSKFEISNLEKQSAEDMINTLKPLLNF